MILNDTLYKRGFSMPYLKCVDKDEAKYILEEIHKGIFGDHASPKSLVSPGTYSRETDGDSLPVAICAMGNRHSRSTTPR